jgi:GNAT superfamily N-acetyltransferase
VSIGESRQGLGIGSALVRNLECRAAALGAARMFGDTLRSNEVMMGVARKAGFAFIRHPDDWKLVRFEKQIDAVPQQIPCASWRLVAQQAPAHAAV